MIEYTPEKRITYEEECDNLYVWKAPSQGQLGSVMLYTDNTDEVGTIVGIDIIGVTKLMDKFKLDKGRN